MEVSYGLEDKEEGEGSAGQDIQEAKEVVSRSL
jgi:hypothetical protein